MAGLGDAPVSGALPALPRVCAGAAVAGAGKAPVGGHLLSPLPAAPVVAAAAATAAAAAFHWGGGAACWGLALVKAHSR